MIQIKKDGSYLIDFHGNPFHVTKDYPGLEQYGQRMTYEAIKAYTETHPEEVCEYEEDAVSNNPPPETDTSMLISQFEEQAVTLLPGIQTGIDVDDNNKRLLSIMLHIEELKGNI